MNDNDAILAELKKISAWTDMQRKAMKWSFVFLALFIPFMIVFSVAMDRHFKKKIDDLGLAANSSWSDVERSLRQGDPGEAIRIGERLIQLAPLYPDGHCRLASAYLAAGKVEKAREHYAEAVRLFPSDNNINLLEAAETRARQTESPPAAAVPAPQQNQE